MINMYINVKNLKIKKILILQMLLTHLYMLSILTKIYF